MRAYELLLMSDRQIADLYSQWSENTYCAGWIINGEEEFVDWILHQSSGMAPYERDGVLVIRKMVMLRMQEKGG